MTRNRLKYNSETGLFYYGARYYNPRESLWLSVDPLAGYNPIFETEHYIDGQHNGGVYNNKNLNVYGYTYQNPVLYVDPNGKQTVFLETRSFAPFSEFGNMPYPNSRGEVGPFKGDNRSHTTAQNASFRIKGQVKVDLAQQTVVDANPGTTITKDNGSGEWVRSDSYLSFNNSVYSTEQYVSIDNWGSNELVFGAPDIDVNVYSRMEKLSSDSKGSSYRISGMVRGDQFPSQELILRDQSGGSVMLSTFSADPGHKNVGPAIMLPGRKNAPMGNFDFTIGFDKAGNMTGALNNKTRLLAPINNNN